MNETVVPIWHPPFEAPSDKELLDKALAALKANNPSEYQRLVRAHDLDEYLRLKVKLTRDLAESLIASGEGSADAWRTAEMQIILERE